MNQEDMLMLSLNIYKIKNNLNNLFLKSPLLLTWQRLVVHPAVAVTVPPFVPTLHEIDVIVTGAVLQLAVEQHE